MANIKTNDKKKNDGQALEKEEHLYNAHSLYIEYLLNRKPSEV